MKQVLPLFHPREADGQRLEHMLVGREEILGEIIETLAHQAHSSSRQHWLIRGQRGIGKTHLMGVVQHRVQTTPELADAYLPLWLPETEVYEIYSTGTLLLAIAEQLRNALASAAQKAHSHVTINNEPTNGARQKQRDWESAIQTLEEGLERAEGDGDSPLFFNDMQTLINKVHKQLGLIFLVLIENFDALFESFSKHNRHTEQSRLRSTLLHEQGLLFLCTTSQVTSLKELSDPEMPLYGQFREYRLSPLSAEDLRLLFERLRTITQQPQPAGQEDEWGFRIQVIHRLTGGLPRSALMMFSVMSGEEGLEALLQDLRRLLDAQTPYFEAQMDRLAPRERTIVTMMALAEQNLTQKEIAEATRLPSRSLSAQLNRLVEQGHIYIVHGEGKHAIYSLSEGLFRIWYQFRKGHKTLRELVYFLAMWYEPEELDSATLRVQSLLATQEPSALQKSIMQQVISHLETAKEKAESASGKQEKAALFESCHFTFLLEMLDQEILPNINDLKNVKDAFQKVVSQVPSEMATPKRQVILASAHTYLSISLMMHEQWVEAEKEAKQGLQLWKHTYKYTKEHKSIKTSDESKVHQMFFILLTILGQSIYQQGRHIESIKYLEPIFVNRGEEEQSIERTNAENQFFHEQAGLPYTKALFFTGQFEKACGFLKQQLQHKEHHTIETHAEYTILFAVCSLLMLRCQEIEPLLQEARHQAEQHIIPYIGVPTEAIIEAFEGIAKAMQCLFWTLSFDNQKEEHIRKNWQEVGQHFAKANAICTNLRQERETELGVLMQGAILSAWALFAPEDPIRKQVAESWFTSPLANDHFKSLLRFFELSGKLIENLLSSTTRTEEEQKEYLDALRRTMQTPTNTSSSLAQWNQAVVLMVALSQEPTKNVEMTKRYINTLGTLQTILLQQNHHPLAQMGLSAIGIEAASILAKSDQQQRAQQAMKEAIHWAQQGASGHSIVFLLMKDSIFKHFDLALVREWFEELKQRETHEELQELLARHIDVLQIAEQLQQKSLQKPISLDQYKESIARMVPEYQPTIDTALRSLLSHKGIKLPPLSGDGTSNTLSQSAA